MVAKATDYPRVCLKRLPKRFSLVTVVCEDGYLSTAAATTGDTFPYRCLATMGRPPTSTIAGSFSISRTCPSGTTPISTSRCAHLYGL
jgi:hypothetical protein